MLNDILSPYQIQWQPSTDQSLNQSVTFLPNVTFYWLMRGFHRTVSTGKTYWQLTLTPPDNQSCPIFGLAYVLLIETNPFPELVVIFPDYALRTWLGTFLILRFCFLPLSVYHCWWKSCLRYYLSGNSFKWMTKKVNLKVVETIPTIKGLKLACVRTRACLLR